MRGSTIAACGITVACAVATAVAARRDIPASTIIGTSQVGSPERRIVESYDERLLRVEQRAPDFGGMFIDTRGRLAVYLLDRSTLPAARAAIEAVFGADRIPAAGLRALQGQYTISQLKAWSEQARAVFQQNADVTLVDLDEARNRVTIGVTADSQINAVERMLSALGIPRKAVIIGRSDRIWPAARHRV